MKNVEYVITAEFHVDKGPAIIERLPLEKGFAIDELAFLPEVMIPDQIHKREEDYTLFILYRNKKTRKFQYLYDKGECDEFPFFLYTVVHNYKSEDVRRGSKIKSISILTKLAYFKHFKPLLIICLNKYFPDNDTAYLQELYDAINKKNLKVSSSISIIRALLLTSIRDLPINETIYSNKKFRSQCLDNKGNENPELFIRKDLSFNSIIVFNNMHIPIKVPMLELPDTIGDYLNPTDLNFKQNLTNILNAKLASKVLASDLTVYSLDTPPLIILINAVLLGKRILVMGYEKLAGEIIDVILLILKIVTGGGILGGLLTNYNIFPIMDVSKIDLLEKCSSYLAGTINPFLKNLSKLWDVLYDLDNNEVHLLDKIEHHGSSTIKYSIISEDARFLSSLQSSIYLYNDDLVTLQLMLRRHINEIIRILLSLKNIDIHSFPSNKKASLLLDGVGYYWNNDENKLMEISCYQMVAKNFQNLLHSGKITYNLLLPNLANELNCIIDLHYYLQSLGDMASVNERHIWLSVLNYLIGTTSQEAFLLITYLIPPASSSISYSSVAGSSLLTFDKNKGVEILLLNLFNHDDQVKTLVYTILQELRESTICGWCVDHFIRSNPLYQMAFEDLTTRALS